MPGYKNPHNIYQDDQRLTWERFQKQAFFCPKLQKNAQLSLVKRTAKCRILHNKIEVSSYATDQVYQGSIASMKERSPCSCDMSIQEVRFK
jgi:hypothetical protein